MGDTTNDRRIVLAVRRPVVAWAIEADITEAVRAVFDIATASSGMASLSLDTEEIAALLTVARAILPADDGTVLDLVAQQKVMATARPELHEFQPDRPVTDQRWSALAVKCAVCGHNRTDYQVWHRSETDAERQLRLAEERVEAERLAQAQLDGEVLRAERQRLWNADHPADVLPDGGF